MTPDITPENDRRQSHGRRTYDGMTCGERHGEVITRLDNLENKQRHTCATMQHDADDIYASLKQKVPWVVFTSTMGGVVALLASVLIAYFSHTEKAYEKLATRMDVNADRATICVSGVGDKIDALSHRVVALETIVMTIQKELERDP